MGKLLILSVLLVLVSMSLQDHEPMTGEDCRILALEGGGDNGAYQAGALKGLFENLPADEVKYDIITGVSLGAFNGALIATKSPGQEKEAAEELYNIWKNLKKNEIYENWTLGFLQGFFYKEGLYNNKPEFKKMESYFKDKTLERYLIIGATNAVTAEYEYFDNEIFNKHGVSGAIMASSALPPLFASYEYIGNHYYDGTIRHSVDFMTAVNMCRDKGFEYDKIIIDVVLCNSSKIEKYSEDTYHPLNALMRLIEILSYDTEQYDVDIIKKYYPEVNIRNLITPSQQFPESKQPYSFEDEDIKFMLELGYKDGKEQSKVSVNKTLKSLFNEDSKFLTK